MSLNVEGLSMPKDEYLSRLLMQPDVDVLHLQETHLRQQSSISHPNRDGISEKRTGNNIKTTSKQSATGFLQFKKISKDSPALC